MLNVTVSQVHHVQCLGRFCGKRPPGDQWGITVKGPTTLALFTDGDTGGLGFHATVTILDGPPERNSSVNDGECFTVLSGGMILGRL